MKQESMPIINDLINTVVITLLTKITIFFFSPEVCGKGNRRNNITLPLKARLLALAFHPWPRHCQDAPPI